LAQVFVGSHFWKGHGVREPIDSKGVADSEGAGDVALVATAVLEGGADAPAVDAMGCHVASLVWGDVDDDSGARRC
jgi:hypothetical protein